ncbi:MAG: CgeB family protein [Terriglobales bacterium]
MQFRYFAHSWLSDWNHGNAHFLRGLATALVRRGHRVRAYEAMPTPAGGWSLSQLWDEPRGAEAVAAMRAAYPDIEVRLYGPGRAGRHWGVCASGARWVESWEEELASAEIVVAHEWNPPELFAWLLEQRRRHGFRLLLHDTHHRAVSNVGGLERLPLRQFDAVIAFGESLRRLYEQAGARRSYSLHEAADLEHVHPHAGDAAQTDLVWIGNGGDEERTVELEEFLLEPAGTLGLRARMHGVRYPAGIQTRLRAAGMDYAGYLPNLEAPRAYAQAKLTLHIPRAPYARALPGIPTIRIFEALACGAALLCAPWSDREGLFAAGEDYWPVANGREMRAALKQLLCDERQRMQLGSHGAATIAAGHTCAHRAQALEEICHDLDPALASTCTPSVPA